MIREKVSIIVPTLNCQDNLPQALKSIIGQTYDNIEVLVIDGLSRDDTTNVARNFSNEYAYIKYISEMDKGVYDAMNKGIKMCNGDWIFFLGSDDSFYDDNVLTDIFDNQQNLKYDVIYGNVVSPLFNRVYDLEFNADKIFHRNICHQAIFFRKKIFDTKGDFNLKYDTHADWDHNLRWFLDFQIKIKYIGRTIANYGASGKSSIQTDPVFMAEKEVLFLKYGKRTLPLELKYHILKKLVLNSLTNRKYFSSIYYLACFLLNASIRLLRLDFMR